SPTLTRKASISPKCSTGNGPRPDFAILTLRPRNESPIAANSSREFSLARRCGILSLHISDLSSRFACIVNRGGVDEASRHLEYIAPRPFHSDRRATRRRLGRCRQTPVRR